ncbi:MAG: hypothetical protein EVJ46_06150 [Candidatus Acididesulfobacter guangdongensis]|jgi:hypothetical protein|uniref:Uncharacterized protein n=1 Tax=Acididesulfobacter guangdongensis TaxID=2597225 RepID=A0A519BH33_ACIG2|nr:MAG: hypothetical protein EVJ46_06150 [Candidatus Acididesulfobacter guangdongensis]
MTTKELKEKLNEFDENLEVLVQYGDIRSYSIIEVSKSKPFKEDDKECEELLRSDIVWLQIIEEENIKNKNKRKFLKNIKG